MITVKKIIRFGKKILSGTDVTKVRHSKEEWERQFETGQWDFLLRSPYNVTVTSGILRRLAADKKALRVLDIGCGNGALAADLGSDQIEYVGTDISEAALKDAATLYPEGTFKQASMEQDPALEGIFDVIVFSEVLLYGDYERILQIHQPYLKKDGLLIISLYDTWRTKIIWRRIAPQFTTLESVYVKNRRKGIGWNIKVCQYK